MKIRRITALIVSLLLCASLLIACGDKKSLTLTGFDVEATAEIQYGVAYAVKVPTPKDSNGNIYSVEYVVTNADKVVKTANGMFIPDTLSDYVVTYTVKAPDNTILTKTTTLKVKDNFAPVISLEKEMGVYNVGDEITLPAVKVIDNIDKELDVTFNVFSKAGDKFTNEIKVTDGKFVATTIGTHLITASSTDSNGNLGKLDTFIEVRKMVAPGEIENFEAESSMRSIVSSDLEYGVPATKGYETGMVGGEVPYGDGFGYIESMSSRIKYLNLGLKPRSTVEQLKAAKDAGFTKLIARVYSDCDLPRSVYHKWLTVNDKPKQTNVGALNSKTWTNFPLNIDQFIDAYDDIMSGKKSFIYFGNDPAYVTQKNFRVYFAGITLARDVTDVVIDPTFGEGKYTNGSSISLDKLTATSATITDAEFMYSVTTPSKIVIKLSGGSYKFTEAGTYTFKANMAPNYIGSAEKLVTIAGEFSDAQALISEMKAMTDRTTSEYEAKAAQLRKILTTLDSTEYAEVYQECAILLSGRSDADKLLYNLTDNGISKIATSQDGKRIPVVNAQKYDMDTFFGNELASTKLTFENCKPREGTKTFYQFNYELKAPTITDFTEYSKLEFYILSRSTERDIEFVVRQGVTQSDNTVVYSYAMRSAANQPIVLTKGVWTKVSLDLKEKNTGGVVKITDLSKLSIDFTGNNKGSGWGDLVVTSGVMSINISNIYLVK